MSADAQAASGARARRGGAHRPPELTGGESLADAGAAAAKIDWLTVTFKPESPDIHVGADVWDIWAGILGGRILGQECAPKYGYGFGVQLVAEVYGSLVPVGRVDWGGDRHQGRARLDISGAGCSRITDWRWVRSWIERQEDAVITRVDLAVDCLMGEYGVEDARDWYLAGEFHAGGRRPRHSTVGDWLDPHYGRTLEVGRRENGKMLRCYEKGRQLGDCASPWTRWEVEIRNVDRVIPFDVLTDRDCYFAGAYECLKRVLPVAGERIRTAQAEGEISLARLVHHSRAAYGQLVEVLRAKLDAGQVLDVLRRPGVPRRLHRPSLTAFHQFGADALLSGAQLLQEIHDEPVHAGVRG